MIRYYSQQHRFYAGVDLHARSMFTHVLDDQGKTVYERDLPARPDAFLDAVRPFRDGWSSAVSACSPGTGWPICARTSTSPSSWGTPWP